MNAPLNAAQHLSPPDSAVAGPGGWEACLTLGFARRESKTVLARRLHRGPLVLQKPLYPEGEDVCHGIILHPPAGIAGGDDLTLDVAVETGGHVLLTTPGAGKWYRTAGARSRMTQKFRLEAGAVCEWLPQESIVFDRAQGELVTEVDLAGSAVYLGMEMVCLGRTGAGERFQEGALALRTRIRRDGKTVWLEQGRLQGGNALLASPAGLAGHPVTGALLVAAPEMPEAVLTACRALRPEAGDGGVTLLPGVLVARYLGPACEPGRAWMVKLWQVLRPALMGRAGVVPRIWHT